MIQPKVGLLPLYLELYDSALPQARPRINEFLLTIASHLANKDLEVVVAPVCRLEDEFAGAVKMFEENEVDAIVTLHLAYSPSLECIKPLAATKLPIIVLDTTPTFSFSPEQDPVEVMFNHGIHGVQDMCSMLIRSSKPFQIEAGHWETSDVLDRVASWARAARIAASMRKARVGRIGESFKGMGDFAVEPDVLYKTIGVETVPCDPALLRSMLSGLDDAEVVTEMTSDLVTFVSDGVTNESHRDSTRMGLALRKWIEKENLSAFTMNFLEFNQESGLLTVPFLEASKAMARGVGYAGEGDVLTAALVGALASVYPETTFTEMFCPDWESNSIFLSHMGEMNIDLTAEVPVLMMKPFPWTDAENPVVAVGRLRGGEAALVNLAPGPDDTYTLIVTPITMLDVEIEDRMGDSVRGWFEPQGDVAGFLEAYSSIGGTHHCALVYGGSFEEIAKFGELMGWNVVILEAESGGYDSVSISRN